MRAERPIETAERADRRLGIALSAPALLLVAAVALFPLGYTLWESLHLHDLHMPWRGRPFIGLANYAQALADERFWGALWHTLFFVAVSVTLELALGLALALLLHRSFAGRGLARTLALLPWALPGVVAALVWQFAFEGQGGVNALIEVLPGVTSAPVWFSSPRWAWVPIVLADVWKTTPFVALLLMAGLQGIDRGLFEAARIDGAGRLQLLWHVILPGLRPALLLALIFRTLDAFRVFDLVYVLSGGGPGTATEPLSLYAFSTLLRDLRFGYGSALSVTVFVVTALLAAIYVWLGRRSLLPGGR
jgi:ABC-type sugar transport system permease subunit